MKKIAFWKQCQQETRNAFQVQFSFHFMLWCVCNASLRCSISRPFSKIVLSNLRIVTFVCQNINTHDQLYDPLAMNFIYKKISAVLTSIFILQWNTRSVLKMSISKHFWAVFLFVEKPQPLIHLREWVKHENMISKCIHLNTLKIRRESMCYAFMINWLLNEPF